MLLHVEINKIWLKSLYFQVRCSLLFYTESPQGFLDILSNPGGKYFFKYKNVNSYVINFSSFPNINYFHEWVQLQNVDFQACHGRRRFAIASVSIKRQSQLLWPFRQARNLSEKPGKLRLDQAFGALVKTEVLSSHPVIKRDIQSCR